MIHTTYPLAPVRGADAAQSCHRPGARCSDCGRAIQRVAVIATVVACLLVSGAVTAYAVGSGGHAWLGCLGLVPLFSAIRWLHPLPAGFSGASWGLTLLVCCVAGLGPPIDWTWRSTLLLIAIPALYCAAGAARTRWIGFSPFVLGVTWMGVEFALVPLGLGDGLLSGTQDRTVLMDGIGRALGYVVIAFLVAYVNALLVEVLGHVPLGVPLSFPTMASDGGVSTWRPQIIGCLSIATLQPRLPRAPPRTRRV